MAHSGAKLNSSEVKIETLYLLRRKVQEGQDLDALRTLFDIAESKEENLKTRALYLLETICILFPEMILKFPERMIVLKHNFIQFEHLGGDVDTAIHPAALSYYFCRSYLQSTDVTKHPTFFLADYTAVFLKKYSTSIQDLEHIRSEAVKFPLASFFQGLTFTRGRSRFGFPNSIELQKEYRTQTLTYYKNALEAGEYFAAYPYAILLLEENDITQHAEQKNIIALLELASQFADDQKARTDALFRLAEYYRHDFEKIKSYWETLLELNPYNFKVMEQLAERLFEENNIPEATRFYQNLFTHQRVLPYYFENRHIAQHAAICGIKTAKALLVSQGLMQEERDFTVDDLKKANIVPYESLLPSSINYSFYKQCILWYYYIHQLFFNTAHESTVDIHTANRFGLNPNTVHFHLLLNEVPRSVSKQNKQKRPFTKEDLVNILTEYQSQLNKNLVPFVQHRHPRIVTAIFEELDSLGLLTLIEWVAIFKIATNNSDKQMLDLFKQYCPFSISQTENAVSAILRQDEFKCVVKANRNFPDPISAIAISSLSHGEKLEALTKLITTTPYQVSFEEIRRCLYPFIDVPVEFFDYLFRMYANKSTVWPNVTFIETRLKELSESNINTADQWKRVFGCFQEQQAVMLKVNDLPSGAIKLHQKDFLNLVRAKQPILPVSDLPSYFYNLFFSSVSIPMPLVRFILTFFDPFEIRDFKDQRVYQYTTDLFARHVKGNAPFALAESTDEKKAIPQFNSGALFKQQNPRRKNDTRRRLPPPTAAYEGAGPAPALFAATDSVVEFSFGLFSQATSPGPGAPATEFSFGQSNNPFASAGGDATAPTSKFEFTFDEHRFGN